MKNPYDVLGVSPASTDAEIRKAYVRLARRYHPDVQGGAEERMLEVNEAWAVLGDPRRRSSFDRAGGADPGEPRGFRPHDPVDDGFDPREMVDVPYRDSPPEQRERREMITVIPVLVFASAVATAIAGFLFDSGAIIGFGVVLFSVACLGMVIVLLVAMADARRDEG